MFKSKVLFLSEKKIFLSKSSDLWEGYDPDSWPKNLQQTFIKQNLQILRKTFGKARRGPQWNLIFCVVGFLSELKKKAQNSDFHWGPLHGEIRLLKLQIFFFKYLRNNSWVKYLKLSRTFNSTLFLPSSNGELCISTPKNVSGIFGHWWNEALS